MELTYRQEGDYLLPDLTVQEETPVTGKYGMLRRTFLKEHRPGLYQGMLLGGELNRHLHQTEEAARERMEVLMNGLLEKYPAPDKEAGQLEWAAHMNSLTAMAEETVLKELVYA